eukprot:gene16018-19066_t
MFVKSFITLAIVLAIASSVHGNAGFVNPHARLACNPGDQSGCGNTQACVLSKPVEGNRFNIDISVANTFTVYQFKPFPSNANPNTYTVQIFINGMPHTIKTVDQAALSLTKGQFQISIPPLDKTIKNLIDFKTPVKAYYQLTFDARNGGGDVYYSCGDVFLVNGNSTAGPVTTAAASTATPVTSATSATSAPVTTAAASTAAASTSTPATTDAATTDIPSTTGSDDSVDSTTLVPAPITTATTSKPLTSGSHATANSTAGLTTAIGGVTASVTTASASTGHANTAAASGPATTGDEGSSFGTMISADFRIISMVVLAITFILYN